MARSNKPVLSFPPVRKIHNETDAGEANQNEEGVVENGKKRELENRVEGEVKIRHHPAGGTGRNGKPTMRMRWITPRITPPNPSGSALVMSKHLCRRFRVFPVALASTTQHFPHRIRRADVCAVIIARTLGSPGN